MNAQHVVIANLVAHKSWGKNAVVSAFPEQYNAIGKQLQSRFPVTNLGTQAVLELLAVHIAEQYSLAGAVTDMFYRLSEETSMIGCKALEDLLREYWKSHSERLKPYPSSFKLLKDTVIELQQGLVSSNSNPRFRNCFTVVILTKLFSLIDDVSDKDTATNSEQLSKSFTSSFKQSQMTVEEYLKSLPLTTNYSYCATTDTYSCELVYEGRKYLLWSHDNEGVIYVRLV